jgi:multidrug resistance efflux pump
LKYALRILGLFAVLFAVYVIAGEQLVGSSGNAYVNAPLAAVRAPLGGTLQMSVVPAGGRIADGEVMGAITDPDDEEAALSWILQGRLEALAELTALQGANLPEDLAQRKAAERLAAYERMLLARRAALVGRNVASVRSPVTGLVWSLPTYSGGYVARGDVIANLADCESLLVHATVDQRIYNELEPGDEAQFRFHDGRIARVTVSQLAGTGARTLFETLAVSPTADQLQGYAVLLEGAALMEDRRCPIGETGRVVFSEGPLGAIDDFVRGLGL